MCSAAWSACWKRCGVRQAASHLVPRYASWSNLIWAIAFNASSRARRLESSCTFRFRPYLEAVCCPGCKVVREAVPVCMARCSASPRLVCLVLSLQAPLFEVLRQLMRPLLALGSAFSRHHPAQVALLKLAGDCVEAHVSYLTVGQHRRAHVHVVRATVLCSGLQLWSCR